MAGLCALTIFANKLITYVGFAPIVFLGIFALFFSLIGGILFHSARSSIQAIKNDQFYICEDTVADKKLIKAYHGSNARHSRRVLKGVFVFDQYYKLVSKNIDAVEYNATQIGDTFYLLKLQNDQCVTYIYPKAKYDLDTDLSKRITSISSAYAQSNF